MDEKKLMKLVFQVFAEVLLLAKLEVDKISNRLVLHKSEVEWFLIGSKVEEFYGLIRLQS